MFLKFLLPMLAVHLLVLLCVSEVWTPRKYVFLVSVDDALFIGSVAKYITCFCYLYFKYLLFLDVLHTLNEVMEKS